MEASREPPVIPPGRRILKRFVAFVRGAGLYILVVVILALIAGTDVVGIVDRATTPQVDLSGLAYPSQHKSEIALGILNGLWNIAVFLGKALSILILVRIIYTTLDGPLRLRVLRGRSPAWFPVIIAFWLVVTLLHVLVFFDVGLLDASDRVWRIIAWFADR